MVEIGWITAGAFDKPLAKAVRRGRAIFAEAMRRQFPQFEWSVPLIPYPPAGDLVGAGTIEPVALLDAALQEREARRLDFALIFWAGDLVGYDRPSPLGAPSAAIACAAAGAARLWEPGAKEPEAMELASVRAAHLASHLLGHLLGLGHADDPADFLHPPHAAADLDRMAGFGPKTAELVRRELADVADPRLEEAEPPAAEDSHRHPFAGRFGAAKFALLAAWQNRDDVGRIFARIRPWAIPRRLGRLVGAAVSTLFVLMITAEAWEFGMSQPAWRVALVSLIALCGASAYLVARQQLIIRPPRHRATGRGTRPARLSEQRSVGNVAVVLAVLFGMAATYAALFVAALLASLAFYPADLIHSWAASVEPPVTMAHHLRLAGTVATLGLTIGALGASFEPRGYVRHVAYVDEEV